MKVYLLRHAEAQPGADDAARPLTAEGERQSRLVGKFLRRAGIEFDAAFASPLVRARQTGEIVLEICQSETEVKLDLTDQLLNETGASPFQRWLGQLTACRRVLLVGHAPSLPAHARALLRIVAPDALKLPKAGLVCISTDDGRRGVLKFMVSPKQLRET